MFSILREISKSDDFRNFIQALMSEHPYLESQTHGVRLAMDDYWLDWWLLRHFAGHPALLQFPFFPFAMQALGGSPMGSRWRALLGAIGYRQPTLDSFVKHSPPPKWTQYCVARGWPANAKPVRIVLSLRPGTALGELQGLTRQSWQGSYPIDLEVRPLVRGHSMHKPMAPLAGGTSIGPSGGTRTESGTLGGVVRHKGESLATTCAHVMNGNTGDDVWHPAAADHSRAASIGSIRTICSPTRRVGELCNRTATYASTADIAVVAIDATIDASLSVRTVGAITGCRLIDAIGANEDVTFVGKESDLREARTEQLSHWQEITIEGNVYCYRDMFTVGSRTHQYIAQTLSTHGDSGSWILSDPGLGTHELLGMLIGGDGEKSFCAFAENFFDAAGLPINELVFQ